MKFTTPVSMPVTEAQYNELKPLLEAMGYEVDNFRGNGTIVSFQNLSNIENFDNADIDGLIKLPTYHRDLFLALAAMTDETNGIAGEWWKNREHTVHFTNSNIYRAHSVSIDGAILLINDGGYRHSRDASTLTKATVAEIFAHFGVSEGDVQSEPIQPEIPQPTPFQGIDRRTYLVGCVLQGLYYRGALYDEGQIIERVDRLITKLDKTK